MPYRDNGDARVHPLAPVVAIDLDGTLGKYHEHFIWFASLYTQREILADWSNTREFSEALGMDKREYRDIKLAFRQGGMKRCLPPFEQVRECVQAIRSDIRAQVWIATTRPWMRLDNIDPDTQFWLDRNVGRVDGVIYGDDKYADLIDIVGRDRILGIIDDLPENVERAKDLGLNASIREGSHNSSWIWSVLSPDLPIFSSTMPMYCIVNRWKDDRSKS
jgi:hypothetical protein